MRYKKPTAAECVDLLNDAEVLYATARGITARQMDAEARAKAWRLHKQTGAVARVRSLCDASIGASVVLSGYTCTPQVGPIVASAARHEGARFATRVERHDLSDAPIGVRVTFLGWTEEQLRKMERDARDAALALGSR